MAGGLVSLGGCVTRFQNDDSRNTGSETAATGSKPISPSLGPLPLTAQAQQALSSFGNTAALAKEYAEASQEFQKVYGSDLNPYNLSIVRSSRFISRNGWDKNKDATDYNPIIMTDKYVLEREQEPGSPPFCRRPDFSGNRLNVWEAFDRAASYVDQLTRSAAMGTDLPWYRNYLRAPVPSSYFASSGRSKTLKSQGFDLDIFLGLHVAGGEGATQDKSSCGRIGQIKQCDVMPYSPFYKPFLTATPCTGAGGWTPTASDWRAMLSSEMRALGQTALPLPRTALIGAHAPQELGGATCSSPTGVAKEKKWRDPSDPTRDGWAELRRSFPIASLQAINQGADFLGQGSASGQLGAFAAYSSVQQSYKELVNMRLKSGVLVNHAACEPCGLVRDSSGKLSFDVFDRQSQNKGFCPISFDRSLAFESNGTPKLDSSGKPLSCIQNKYIPLFERLRKDNDVFRDLFEVDTSEPSFPSVSNVLNSHFAEFRARSFREDPIERASWIQQKTVAMHPFIDGDGRLSRFLMESTLHSASLPFPMLTDFWSDTQTSVSSYAGMIREGVTRQIGAIKACSAFAACASNALGFGSDAGGAKAVQSICSSASKTAPSQCLNALTFSYGTGKSDTLKPCDCNALWNDNPRVVKWATCP